MDLHQLRLFQALATTGNFSKAAKASHISQPALWIQIKNLEGAVGTPLVDRLPRGIQLTDAGRLVLECAQRMFALEDDLHVAVSDLKGLRRGTLMIGASTTPGIYILPDALGRFKLAHPGVEFDLRIGNTQQVEEWVLNREVLLGIIGQEPHHNELRFEFYLDDVLIAIVPGSHRLAKHKSVSIKDLAREPFLARERGSNTRDTYEKAFRTHGVSLQIAMELGSTEAIKRAVVAGLGISIVSPFSVQWELARKQLAGLRLRESGFERHFNIIDHRRRQLPEAARAFVALLKAAM